MENIAILGLAFAGFFVFLLLAGLAERYIPDSVWDKLSKILRFE